MATKLKGKKLLILLILSSTGIAAVNLVVAYRARSLWQTIEAVVVFLIIGPLLAIWWVRTMESDSQ